MKTYHYTTKRNCFIIDTTKNVVGKYESYRPNKNLGTVPSECDREPLQPLAESKRPEPDSKRTNKSNRTVCKGDR